MFFRLQLKLLDSSGVYQCIRGQALRTAILNNFDGFNKALLRESSG